MKVDIWSDIRCPFCFIGKRKFALALRQFPHRQEVEVNWHSFQLDPGLSTQPDVHVFDYLAAIKGITREQAVELHARVAAAGSEVGIVFNFERTVVANSFNAHRLIQFARSKRLADEAEEEFFLTHFTHGKNIDDINVLMEVGTSIGLAEAELRQLFASTDAFAAEVNADEMAARSRGIRGVPFFLFNETFAVSGAQPPEVFLQALVRAREDTIRVAK